jgi:site-specific DNA-methyltransferase (adenine-specific)
VSSLRDALFHEEPGITLYCGDSRELLPLLDAEPETVITDPVWPNAHPDLAGSDDPTKLFQASMDALPTSVVRLCVWLGCQSDPRFLEVVPARFPFLRMCYMRRAVPSYNGRCLVSGDVLYAFGEWPASRQGARVLPGEMWRVTSIPKLRQAHPAARNEEHARWVVKWWGEGLVCDPFAGTGTTLIAAKDQGVSAIGIEIEPRYCEIAVKRLRQEVLL